ncbi:ash family protein [Pasteurella skyensis]|uniref:Ash family protein n=1 Tax=Phocoenobacter skyensis TaxID=97481 RepID=A0AAJ6ND45_9PAST|nr:ash family protein [Pasteurella skyensis]MDP8170557.1 ash family protein [Pasteurella skyensis]MDP8174616.1 ash family protein [Pasteurella skyensis]
MKLNKLNGAILIINPYKTQTNEQKTHKTNKKTIENHQKQGYIVGVVAKSTTERRNSNDITLANNNTPFQACFFVCTYPNIDLSYDRLFSMVARDEKGFALCYIPVYVVFDLVTCYRPSVETLAVIPENLTLELSAMIYLLLCVNRTKPTFNTEIVRIQAPNADEARFKLTADYQLLTVCGRLNPQRFSRFAKNHKNSTACTLSNNVQGGLYA